MMNLPVKDSTFDYLLYCLSIGWGNKNEINSYLKEAYRVGKDRCNLKIICTKSEYELIKQHIEHDFIDKIKILNNKEITKFIHIDCVIEKLDNLILI